MKQQNNGGLVNAAILAGGGGIAGFLFEMLREWIFSKPTISVAIVGMKGAGKTTLFDAIRGENRVKSDGPTDAVGDELKRKTIKVGGKELIISASYDYGGDAANIKKFQQLFKDKEYIIFLFDARKWIENVGNYRDRVMAMLDPTGLVALRKDHKLLLIAGTHIDELTTDRQEGKCFRDRIRKRLYERMDSDNLKKIKDTFRIDVVDLTNPNYAKSFLAKYLFKNFDA